MQRNLSALGEQTYDLAIIGGGINGAATAREAALRGLKVALVEARDFSCGTSSRSSKLIHGGLRYLEQFDFKLVHESRTERRILLALAPHLGARPGGRRAFLCGRIGTHLRGQVRCAIGCRGSNSDPRGGQG